MRCLPQLICAVAILVMLNSGALHAQNVGAMGSPPVDTIRTVTDTGGFHMTKSPLTAVLLSAVLPGAGQAYLDQYWKVPIIWGVIGGFFYGEQIQNLRYHQAQHSVDTANADTTNGGATGSFFAHAWENAREFYRDDRDKWWIYLGITYIATILDAYIASHLYDFDVSDPAPSVSSFYNPVSKQVGMSFSTRF